MIKRPKPDVRLDWHDPTRDYLLIVEDKINKGYGAYWWCLRSKLLKQILEVQLRNFDCE